ncbi:hypothetical protein [Zoogloea sp.]|uniref:hypothetical protein n=1 Tax=Zoogloea sp. TaxID=49181 RepID=UPI0037DA2D9A
MIRAKKRPGFPEPVQTIYKERLRRMSASPDGQPNRCQTNRDDQFTVRAGQQTEENDESTH